MTWTVTNKPGIGEFGRIAAYFAPLAADNPGALGLRDDAALLSPADGHELVVSTDTIVEGVHFLGQESAAEIAAKLMRVNLSDLAAKGARPKAYTLNLALPAAIDDRWLQGFAERLGEEQQTFGITLLGGDSVSTPGVLTLTLTGFGEVKTGGMIRRAGARAGDVLCVSGTIGDAALGLEAARGALGMGDGAAYLRDRYLVPQPRVSLGVKLGAVATAGLDISDGLVADAGHMAAASEVGLEIDCARVPLSNAAEELLAGDPDLLETVLTGGDDYELLFTVPEAELARVHELAADAKIPVTEIGRVIAGDGVALRDRHGNKVVLSRSGFTHA